MRSAPLYRAYSLIPAIGTRDKASERRLSEVASFTLNQPHTPFVAFPFTPKGNPCRRKETRYPSVKRAASLHRGAAELCPCSRRSAEAPGGPGPRGCCAHPGLTAPLDPEPGPAPCVACRQPAMATVPDSGRTREFALLLPPEKPPGKTPAQWGKATTEKKNPERQETPQRPTPISPPPLRAGM